MLSEFSVAGILLPPLFIYLLASTMLFLLLRKGLVQWGILARLWYPALFEFSLSLALLAVLVLYV